MKNASDEKENIYQYLNQMIDRELDKPEPDMDFIEECNSLLDAMEQGKYEPDPAVKRKELQKLYKAYHDFGAADRKITAGYKMKWSRIVAAACICLLMITLPLATVAVTGDTPQAILNKLGEAIYNWKIGEAVEVDGLVFTRYGEPRQYDTVEECLRTEELDIYYPGWLPEGVDIEELVVYNADGCEHVSFVMNTEALTYSVRISETMGISEQVKKDYSILQVNGITVYYADLDNRYGAQFEIDGNTYHMSVPSLTDLNQIVENLRNEDE